MKYFDKTALTPTVISLSNQTFIATIFNDENQRTYFIKEDVQALASILQEMELCEDFANGEVDFVNAGGELQTWSFSDFWDKLEGSEQRDCINTLLLEMAAMEFPKKPITIPEFLNLNSIQQQNFVDYAVATVGMKYRWIYSFGRFAKGYTTDFNKVWGAKMSAIGKLFWLCLDAETIRKNLFARIDRSVAAHEKIAA
jgi:hypothetical protein